MDEPATNDPQPPSRLGTAAFAFKQAKAQEKLARFTTKIGYPSKWRDYSALQIVKDDLTGNVIRAQSFEYNRNLNKLGKPIDRDGGRWGMTPQTVSALTTTRR